MKWSIIQLQKFRDSVMNIDEVVDVRKELQLLDPEIRNVSPVHITGKADIGAQKVVFHLHITGNFILPCSRTLVDVEYPFNIQSNETFLLKPIEGHEETDEFHDAQAGVIDLIPVIQELLLLEIPIQVFSEDAQGDATGLSGQGWEVLTEEQYKFEQEQKKQRVDPRLASLAQLLEDKKD